MFKRAYFLFTTQQPDKKWCCSRCVLVCERYTDG